MKIEPSELMQLKEERESLQTEITRLQAELQDAIYWKNVEAENRWGMQQQRDRIINELDTVKEELSASEEKWEAVQKTLPAPHDPHDTVGWGIVLKAFKYSIAASVIAILFSFGAAVGIIVVAASISVAMK